MLHTWKSLHPENEYAPTWSIPFWNTQFPDQSKVDKMRQWIIDNETNIVEKYKKNTEGDGGTGLGENSLTAQYNSYNLFQVTREIPVFKDLLNWIQSEYVKFMHTNGTLVRDLYMYSWANVVHKGQPITQHGHGAQHFSYLSGNIHLDNYATKTVYYAPADDDVLMEFPNVKGGLTFFPSHVLHSVPVHNEDNKRVSMAFDLFDMASKNTITTDLHLALRLKNT